MRRALTGRNGKLTVLVFAVLLELIFTAGSAAYDTHELTAVNNAPAAVITPEPVTLTAESRRIVSGKTAIGGGLSLEVSAGWQYVMMNGLNFYLFNYNKSAPFSDKKFTPANSAFIAEVAFNYNSGHVHLGPKIGLLNCESAVVHFSTTFMGMPTEYDYAFAASMIPLEVGFEYDLPLTNPAVQDWNYSVFFSAYSGYGWGCMNVKYYVVNDPTYGNYDRYANFYGGGVCADFDIGVKYADAKDQGLYFSLTAGYRYADLPVMKADKDYVTVTTRGPTLAAWRKGSTFFEDTDLRGMRLAFDAGILF